jgi:S1-C subfamily serine protease
MSLEVTCPWCGAEFTAADACAGSNQPCPACGKPVPIPLVEPLPVGKLIYPGQDLPPGDSKAVIDRSSPPVVRRSVPVPPPLPEEPATTGVAGASSGWPVVSPDKPPAAGFSVVSTGGKGVSTQRTPAEARPVVRRRTMVPRWAWTGLAAAALLAVLLAALHFTGRVRNREAARAGTSEGQQAYEEPELAEDVGKLAEPKPTPGPSKSKPQTPSKAKPSIRPAAKLPVARCPDDVVKAIVKINLPGLREGSFSTGAGFLINDFGWVATNYHVVANANTAARAEFVNGQQYQLEGFIAQDPQHDLAIVKLADFPLGAAVLDISYDQTPKVGTEVFAVGHPLGLDFTVSKGIVSRVLSTEELQRQGKEFGGREIRAPSDTIWIQHDAKTSAGNSGGPLVDSSGRVLAVNSFNIAVSNSSNPHLKIEYGYAIHVRYLRALAEKATGQLQPLPAAHQSPKPDGPKKPPSLELDLLARLNDLLVQAMAFEFSPADQGQYAVLAETAGWLTAIRSAQDKGKGSPDPQVQTLAALAPKADELFAQIAKVKFDQKRIAAINQFAQAQLGKQREGIMTVATLIGRGPDALLFAIEGSEKTFVVEVPRDVAEGAQTSRWLIMGISQDSREIVDKQGNTMQVQKVLSYHLHRLE